MTTTLPSRPVAALSRIALGQHGLVTRSQSAGVGCTDEVLEGLCRRGALAREYRGVFRFTSNPRTLEQRALAACLASGGAACRLTAVGLYGFDLACAGVSERRPPDVLCSSRLRQPRHGGYVVHRSRRLADDDIGSRHGVPLTSPARTLRDVARLLRAPVVDRLLGHLLATRQLEPSDLRRLAAGVLAPAIERAGVATEPDSVLEHRALVLLRGAGLPEPIGQFPVHAGDGGLLGVLDFAWPERRVALEVDGYRWHGDPSRFTSDRRRDNLMKELGWSVYRTTSDELCKGGGPLLRQLGRELGGAPFRSSAEMRDHPASRSAR